MKSYKAEVVKSSYDIVSIDCLSSMGHSVSLCLQCDEADELCHSFLNKLFGAASQLRVGWKTLLHYAPNVCYGEKGIRSPLIGHFKIK